MSTIRDYSAEEWKTIVAAPTAAGLLITLSDASGPLGIMKESLAMTRAVTDATDGSLPEVVQSIVAEVRSGAVRPQPPSLPMTDRAKAKTTLMDAISAAVAAVEAKAPTEVAAFKTWLVATAVRVAQASKEGGFLGFGGTLVSPEERAAIDELAAALGVTAPN